MKKILIVSAVLLLIAAGVSWFAAVSAPKKSSTPAAGGSAEDFILGMKNSVTYRLSDFMGRRVIVLAFLDRSINSQKFEEACAGSLASLFADRNDLIWFNIKRENLHAVISEQTKTISLMYRTLYKDLPAYYDFSSLPAVLVIDKTGTIKLVYSGYSPTIFRDIYSGLPKTAK